jgi:dTDP-4-dehydrorhamnose 3,5-epimerase
MNISGVELVELTTHPDSRGSLTEVFRRQWYDKTDFLQWNLVNSLANTLRGVHVHVKHSDLLTCTMGHVLVGLHDIRDGSPTRGESTFVQLSARQMSALLVPPGVAHGFYFQAEASMLYAVSEYWSLNDELGCLWNDPELRLAWPAETPILSDRDRQAGSAEEMRMAWHSQAERLFGK